MTVVNIKWGREKQAVEFKDRILADIKLGELRQYCHEWTKVPLGGLTLIYGGATMKDDNAPLSCFGIKPNGQITMMGTRPSVSCFVVVVCSKEKDGDGERGKEEREREREREN